ncbi:hypothetical protein BX070DRAFT_220767 [Coemansia spiralis]|nr:hypothetical protein BX070DRAFT_220767 [Coemansia spiralis]
MSCMLCLLQLFLLLIISISFFCLQCFFPTTTPSATDHGFSHVLLASAACSPLPFRNFFIVFFFFRFSPSCRKKIRQEVLM